MAVVEKKQESISVEIPKRTFTVEFWVGIFTIIGVAAFGYLAINIAGMRLLQTNFYDLLAEFNDVSGLQLGAPVEIAGVQIGEVKEIDLKSTMAKVTLQIKNGTNLRDDDIAIIRTKGIIGDKYIKIVPGGSDEKIPPGGEIAETESAVDFEDIIGKIIHRLE